MSLKEKLEGEGQINFLPIGSLNKWLQQLSLEQAEAKSLELASGSSVAFRGH